MKVDYTRIMIFKYNNYMVIIILAWGYNPQPSTLGHISRPKRFIPYIPRYPCLIPFHYFKSLEFSEWMKMGMTLNTWLMIIIITIIKSPCQKHSKTLLKHPLVVFHYVSRGNLSFGAYILSTGTLFQVVGSCVYN